jgi:hypothetical protein
MPFLAFTQSSYNLTLASPQFVFPSCHAERWAENAIEHKGHDSNNTKKGENNSYKFDCTLRNELPVLLGIHSREEFMPRLSNNR